MDAEAVTKQIEMLANGLAVLRRMIEQDSPTFPEEAQALVDAGKCLNCKKALGSKRPLRGCHESCYRQTKRAIDAGKLTDFEAVENGLYLPKDAGGGRPSPKKQLAKVLAEKVIAEASQRVAKKQKSE